MLQFTELILLVLLLLMESRGRHSLEETTKPPPQHFGTPILSKFSHHLGKHSGICWPTQSSWLPRGFELQLRESPQLGSIRNHQPLPSTVFVTLLLRMTLRASPIQPGSWYFNSRKADTGKEQMNCLRHQATSGESAFTISSFTFVL